MPKIMIEEEELYPHTAVRVVSDDNKFGCELTIETLEKLKGLIALEEKSISDVEELCNKIFDEDQKRRSQ